MAKIEKTAVSRSRPPDFIPGYRLEKLVGKGGMGEVHKATQLSLGRTVAVKLLSTELAQDETFVARFEKEGTALAALSHPNIVSVVDRGRTAGTYYLVMEFVDGPSMREVMRSPLLEPHTALRMMLEVCRAIDYAHHRGIIHRDLKPENILFDDQAGGIAKVSDFGLAGFVDGGPESKAAKLNLTQTHMAMGTASYMAPEQKTDAKAADHRADIYSLGVILYEVLCSELPVGNFYAPSQKKPGLDKRIDAIVARCLMPAPADRYQSVMDLICDLEPLVPMTHSMRPQRVTKGGRALRLVKDLFHKTTRVASVVLVLTAMVVLTSAWLRARKPSLRRTPGVELTTELTAKQPQFSPGRLEIGSSTQRTLSLGTGPDSISVVPLGRELLVEKSGALVFQEADESAAGRAVLDVNIEGLGLTLAAVAEVAPPDTSVMKAALLGPPPSPKAALLLVGEPGRYVALVISPSPDSPPALEWALGTEKRGTMTTALLPHVGALPLGLVIEPKTGLLYATLGRGRDKRPVAEPLNLGPDWRKYFGQMPRAAVGCLGGACRFDQLELVVQLDAPADTAAEAPGRSAPPPGTKRPTARKH